MPSQFSLSRASRYASGIGLFAVPLVSNAAVSHAFEDTLANAISWVAVTAMPLVAIYLFWKIHVLPEVIAEKRHHPQAEAIKVLCLLSLVFGGLLWPIAWLWAYMKPIQIPVVRGRRKRDPWHAALYDDAHSPDGHQAKPGGATQDAPHDASGDAGVTRIDKRNETDATGSHQQGEGA